tara:strand:- start:2077 stop:2319 length:243 start_codon:yes stop_codon:yes gene_type:complete
MIRDAFIYVDASEREVYRSVYAYMDDRVYEKHEKDEVFSDIQRSSNPDFETEIWMGSFIYNDIEELAEWLSRDFEVEVEY